jgi:hypothetical protein
MKILARLFSRHNIHTLSFAAIAVTLIAWEISHWYTHKELEDHWLLIFTANLLAALAFVVVVEKLFESSRKVELDAVFDEMRLLVAEMQKRVGILFIEGQHRIFAKVGALFFQARTSIKILIVDVAAPAPESFGEDLSKFLLEHPGVICEVVIAVSQPDEQFWKTNDERLKFYERHGLVDRRFFVSIVEVSRPIGFNVAVVDNKHCFIGFPPIPATRQTAEAALIFDNQPKIAEKLNKWLDKVPDKKPYAAARASHLK